MTSFLLMYINSEVADVSRQILESNQTSIMNYSEDTDIIEN